MNNCRRKFLGIFLLFAVLFGSVITYASTQSDNYMKIDEYRSAGGYTAPTKEGFVFDGWYVDYEYKQQFDFSTEINQSLTL